MDELTGQTPIVDLLRSVPISGGWRTYSENIDDPMAGSHIHGDTLERAADKIERQGKEIATLRAELATVTRERDEARAETVRAAKLLSRTYERMHRAEAALEALNAAVSEDHLPRAAKEGEGE